MQNSKIQWCDSTINPSMGCDGCPLFPSPAKVSAQISNLLVRYDFPLDQSQALIHRTTDGYSLTDLYQARQKLGLNITAASGLGSTALAQEIEKTIAQNVRCYAATLHMMRGLNRQKPEIKGNKGHAPFFEEVTLFPGRMLAAAKWKPLTGELRLQKPWLNHLPRLIFVSDMGDSLSAAVPFGFLTQEIIASVTSAVGARHLWLWLTKRPARMTKLGHWLSQQGITWPDNLVAMTSVLDQKMAKAAVSQLLRVPAKIKALSIEPLAENVTLDLQGINWVITGGESGHYARPFDLSWARSIRDQCRAQGVAFFMKQLGAKPMENRASLKLKDPHGGDWDEWPDDLRVREMPAEFRDFGQRDC